MDNFPSGQVNVYWVDGHTSMCWPQDLYKVLCIFFYLNYLFQV